MKDQKNDDQGAAHPTNAGHTLSYPMNLESISWIIPNKIQITTYPELLDDIQSFRDECGYNDKGAPTKSSTREFVMGNETCTVHIRADDNLSGKRTWDMRMQWNGEPVSKEGLKTLLATRKRRPKEFDVA